MIIPIFPPRFLKRGAVFLFQSDRLFLMVAHFPYSLNTEALGEQGNFAATGDRRVLQNNRNRWNTADTNNDYDGRTVRDIFAGGLRSRSGAFSVLLRYYLSDDLRGVSSFEYVRLTEYTRARIPDDNTDWLIGWQDIRGADPNFPDVPQGPIPNPATIADPANYQGGQGLGDPLYYNNFKNTDITVQVGARNRQVIESQALAWQDRIAAGYAKVRHPETGTIIDDVSQPIFGPPNGTATYGRVTLEISP